MHLCCCQQTNHPADCHQSHTSQTPLGWSFHLPNVSPFHTAETKCPQVHRMGGGTQKKDNTRWSLLKRTRLKPQLNQGHSRVPVQVLGLQGLTETCTAQLMTPAWPEEGWSSPVSSPFMFYIPVGVGRGCLWKAHAFYILLQKRKSFSLCLPALL